MTGPRPLPEPTEFYWSGLLAWVLVYGAVGVAVMRWLERRWPVR